MMSDRKPFLVAGTTFNRIEAYNRGTRVGRSSLGGLARVHPGFRAKSPCLLVGILLLTASRSALTLILERLVGPGAAGALGRGALATLIVNLIAAVFGLLLHVALTWFLGNETEYGIYLVAVSAINLLVIPIIAGWDTVLTRFLSQYGKDGLTDKSRHLYAEASRKLLLRCCVALPLLALVLIPILNYGFPRSWAAANAWTYGVVIACVPPLALSLLRQGALKGLHRPAASLLPESIVKPLSVIGVLLLLISLGNRPTGTLALFSHLGASILAFLLGTLLLPRMLRQGWLRTIFSERVPQTSADSNQGVGDAEENPRKAAWKSLAVSATIMGLSFVVLSRIDEFLLGIMDSPATAGLYGPASRYAMFVTFGLSVVNPMLGALIARHQDDRAELQRLVKRSARLAAIISTPLAMGMMFAPEIPLSLLPPAYLSATCALRILAAAHWINTLFGSVGMVLMMTGHHRDLAVILVLTSILDVILNILLIPQLGDIGAAVATGTSIVVWNAAAWVMVRVRLGINTSAV